MGLIRGRMINSMHFALVISFVFLPFVVPEICYGIFRDSRNGATAMDRDQDAGKAGPWIGGLTFSIFLLLMSLVTFDKKEIKMFVGYPLWCCWKFKAFLPSFLLWFAVSLLLCTDFLVWIAFGLVNWICDVIYLAYIDSQKKRATGPLVNGDNGHAVTNNVRACNESETRPMRTTSISVTNRSNNNAENLVENYRRTNETAPPPVKSGSVYCQTAPGCACDIEESPTITDYQRERINSRKRKSLSSVPGKESSFDETAEIQGSLRLLDPRSLHAGMTGTVLLPPDYENDGIAQGNSLHAAGPSASQTVNCDFNAQGNDKPPMTVNGACSKELEEPPITKKQLKVQSVTYKVGNTRVIKAECLKQILRIDYYRWRKESLTPVVNSWDIRSKPPGLCTKEQMEEEKEEKEDDINSRNEEKPKCCTKTVSFNERVEMQLFYQAEHANNCTTGIRFQADTTNAEHHEGASGDISSNSI